MNLGKKEEANVLKARDHLIYRLKINLADAHPPLWRRIEVFGGMEMDSLDAAIQAVFGWSGDHMAEFDIKGRRIGDGTHWLMEEDPRAAEKKLRQRAKLLLSSLANKERAPSALELFAPFTAQMNETSKPADAAAEADTPTLCEVVPRVRTKFIYIYDFGDNWKHVIEVEKLLEAEAGAQYPRCTGGARANPIEDCGGLWGYNSLVQAAGNPHHERYADLEEWGMEKWDPEKFSVEEADRKLARVFRRKKG